MPENAPSELLHRRIGSVEPTRMGDSNADIIHVQTFLEKLDYMEGDFERGTVDLPTSEALRAFQRRVGRRPLGHFNLVTRREMSQPRCGIGDGVIFARALTAAAPDTLERSRRAATDAGLPATDDVAAQLALACRWPRTEVTYTFGNSTNDIETALALGAVRRAFRTWSRVGPVTFREVARDEDPDVAVAWARDDPCFRNCVAYAEFPPGCPSRCGNTSRRPRRMRFNDRGDRWTTDAIQAYAVHEISHVLGVANHPQLGPGSVLHAVTGPDPSPEDIAFVQAVYA